MSIKIETLRCFCEVAQSGNLNDAADRLGRTPSALSMTLKQFEETLGAKLFEGERKNQLSALGLQVYRIAQVQLRNFNEAISSIESIAKAPLGLLRIASIPSVAERIFTETIGQMTIHHPEVKFELRDADSPSIYSMLTQGQIDIGIASSTQPINGVSDTALFSDKIGLVCSKQHPLTRTVPTLNEVFDAGYLINNVTANIRPPTDGAVPGRDHMTVHNSLSLIAMLSSGNWVSILPESVIGLAPSKLTFIEIPEISLLRDVSLFTHQNSPFPYLANEFSQILLASFRGD